MRKSISTRYFENVHSNVNVFYFFHNVQNWILKLAFLLTNLAVTGSIETLWENPVCMWCRPTILEELVHVECGTPVGEEQ